MTGIIDESVDSCDGFQFLPETHPLYNRVYKKWGLGNVPEVDLDMMQFRRSAPKLDPWHTFMALVGWGSRHN